MEGRRTDTEGGREGVESIADRLRMATVSMSASESMPLVQSNTGAAKGGEETPSTSGTAVRIVAVGLIAAAVLPYLIASMLGHVPIILPMISDCQVLQPEAYVSKPLMLSFGFAGLAYVATLQYKSFALASETLASITTCIGALNKANLLLAYICSFATGIAGAVNEKANNDVHSAAALLAFMGWCTWMWMSSFLFGMLFASCGEESGVHEEARKRGRKLLTRKLFTAAFMTVCLSIGIGFLQAGYMSDTRGHTAIATAEWASYFSIAAFAWTVAIQVDLFDGR